MIVLFCHKTRCETDGGGVDIEKRVLAPPPPRAIYRLPAPHPGRVPSLSWFCLQRLAEVPDQVHLLGVRLHYDEQRDVLDGEDDGPMDPRFWATLVQVYDNLPPRFNSLTVPLSDAHVPLLQRIPSTPQFSLLTLLDLPACPHLTDDTISALSQLHSLTALDASGTVLSPYGIKVLSSTLLWVDDGPVRRGPWGLRILRLRYCTKIDNKVFPHLSKFPLLSVIDLQGTGCAPNSSIPFRPSSNPILYHPSPLSTALSVLSSSTPNLNSSQNTYSLIINTLNHRHTRPKIVVAPQDSYVVLPPSHVKAEPYSLSRSKKLFTGNSETLQRRKESLENVHHHELNKEAWYARNPGATQRYYDRPSYESSDEEMKYGSEESNDDRALSDEDENSEDEDSSSDEDDDPPDHHATTSTPAQTAVSGTAIAVPLMLPPSPSRPHRTFPMMHLPTTAPTVPVIVPAAVIAQPSTPSPHPHATNPPDYQQQAHPTISSATSLPRHAVSLMNMAMSLERPIQPIPDQPEPPRAPPPLNRHSTSESLPQLFYNRGLIPKPLYDPEKNYSAEMYYSACLAGGSGGATGGRPTNRHDASLMLYRDPPAWCVLETYSADLLAKSRSVRTSATGEGVAAVNRAKIGVQIDQARIDALRESASAKRRSSLSVSHAHKTPLPNEAAAQGRNPFRRQSHSGSGNLAQASSSSSHIVNEVKRRGEMKPLKPISSVKVPLLPTSLRSQSSVKKTIAASKNNVNSEKVKPGGGGIPMSTASFVDKDSNSATPRSVKPPAPTAWAGSRTPGEAEAPVLKRSGSVTGNMEVVRKKIRVGDPLPAFAGKKQTSSMKKELTTTRSNVKKSSAPKQGFDWGSWGKRGQ
ncbi:hypothetical protein Hypma_011592 [Hypsizygus marmoreus]|uniref:Uncharacterized protein n=1 Tax=Hypsizygus marmoreus TaxID=39966 RepID=A0A369JRF3_HYPMA|nr:hypothetical protein Hypma_011592 [Hypsizygus marmoreus]